MNREALDRFCERGILVLVLAILVFAPLATAGVRTQELLVIMALSSGVLVLWVARLWLSKKPKFLCPPICWAVLAFTGYALWRYANCDIEYVGRLEFLRILVYAFLFFAILNNLHGQESTQIVSFTLIFLAMAISLCAVWQFLAGARIVPSLSALAESLIFSHKTWYFRRAYMDRGSGTYINPNHLAGMLEMLLPLAVAYTLVGRSKAVTRVVLGYAVLMMLAGIGVTVSRGSWVAAGFALLLLFGTLAVYRSYRFPALVLLVVLVASSALVLTRTDYFKQRFSKTFVSGTLDLNVRYDLWQATVEMWRDHFWLGVGPGHYDHRFRAYRPQSVQLQPDRAHNDYLNLLADWGVAGAAIVGLGLVMLLAGVIKTWPHVRRPEREFKTNFSNKFAYIVGATCGLVALLVHSLLDFNLEIPANALIAVTLTAFLSSHLRFASERYWMNAGLVLRSVVSILLVAGAVWFSQQEIRLGREYVWLERASTKGNYSDAKIAALEKAYAAEPKNSETTWGIAESYRVQAFEGGEGYERLGQQALLWYGRGTNTNPHHGYNFLGSGRCLDYLGRTNEARPFFDRADELDPNGYFTSALIGRHYVEVEDYAAAKAWFEYSLKLEGKTNQIATAWLDIVKRKLAENAAGNPGVLAR